MMATVSSDFFWTTVVVRVTARLVVADAGSAPGPASLPAKSWMKPFLAVMSMVGAGESLLGAPIQRLTLPLP
jgi:hypothetical protein